MKINNVKYLLKEGIRGIFLNGFMSFAAVCVTIACLLIVGMFASVMYNVNVLVEEMNKTNEIIAYIDEELPLADAKSVGSQINLIENVQNSVFVTREEALENFAEEMGADALSGTDASYLRHRYVITLMDNAKMKDTVKAVEKIEGVSETYAEYAMAEAFITIQNIIHIASFAIIILLIGVSLLIISNTVKLAMYDRKDEIAIMKMVGATNGFIRLPFVVEGFTLGIAGAAVAFGIEWLLYNAIVSSLEAMDTALDMFNFVPFGDLLWFMIATFLSAGLFVGIVGSWISIRKFMDV